MKNIGFILILLLCVNYNIIAQHSKHENFKAYKIAFITEQLDLLPEEAELFWPIYNVYGKKAYKIKVLNHRELKSKIRDNGGLDVLSDVEVDEFINSLLLNEQELVNLKQEFYSNLKKILPSKKILKLYHAENAFNKRLLSEFRKEKHKQRRE